MPTDDELKNAGSVIPPEVSKALEMPPTYVSPAEALNPMPGTAGMAGKQTVIPPSSPRVRQAINRVKAYLPDTHNQTVLLKNIEIMQRGGPVAEAMAAHMLKTFQPHPNEGGPKLEAPTIEGSSNLLLE